MQTERRQTSKLAEWFVYAINQCSDVATHSEAKVEDRLWKSAKLVPEEEKPTPAS